MSDETKPDLSLRLAQGLRSLEAKYPKSSFAAGFVPVLGQIYSAASTAAALRDPQATKLEKGLAAASMLPLGRMAKGLRKRDITTYHGSSAKNLDKEGFRIPQTQDDIISGNVDGVGTYSATSPLPAAKHWQLDSGQRYLYELDIPDATLPNYIPNIDNADIEASSNVKDYILNTFGGKNPDYKTALRNYWNTIYNAVDEPTRQLNLNAHALRHGVKGSVLDFGAGSKTFVTFDPTDISVKNKWELSPVFEDFRPNRAAGADYIDPNKLHKFHKRGFTLDQMEALAGLDEYPDISKYSYIRDMLREMASK